ncbi:unnamed protein product [Ectocarpus sp. 13 AM-2016]
MATSPRHEDDHEAEGVLLRRLDALERLVFGRSCSAASSGTAGLGREVEPLAAKVKAICKSVAQAEGGDRNLQDIAAQAARLGLLSPLPSTTTAASTHNVALKENILYAARGEIETTARLLSQVKTLQEHVNPPYLKDMPQLTARLSRLEGTYVQQAAEVAQINERAENALLHYSEAVNLVSEKFVHWDDQVAELERQHASRS